MNHQDYILQSELQRELTAYEEKTPMNRYEKRALRKWVRDGHSVYEAPPSMFYCTMEGEYDYLEIYRMDHEILNELKGKSKLEREKCLDELFPERNPLNIPRELHEKDLFSWLMAKALNQHEEIQSMHSFLEFSHLTEEYEMWNQPIDA